MDSRNNVRRADMIEMLRALDAALDSRMVRWKKEAMDHRKRVLSPAQAKKEKQHVHGCMIRVDEINAIRGLVMATIETCKEQNDATD